MGMYYPRLNKGHVGFTYISIGDYRDMIRIPMMENQMENGK